MASDHQTPVNGYEILSLINCARFALENDDARTPIEQRGIEETLKIASEKTGELIDLMERQAAA